jgi:hypothetical protein
LGFKEPVDIDEAIAKSNGKVVKGDFSHPPTSEDAEEGT